MALTAFDHDELVASALRAGARGYLGKDASGADLARAVLAAAHGGALLSGHAVERLQAHFNGALELSGRERRSSACWSAACRTARSPTPCRSRSRPSRSTWRDPAQDGRSEPHRGRPAQARERALR